MALATGYYAPEVAKKVTHWPAPDANGDGEQVWEEKLSADGSYMGRDAVRDNNGNNVYHYNAPEGFRNVPSKEAGANGITDNYVKVDVRGRIVRHPKTGAAYGIRPGTTLVEHPNGDAELLEDDFSRYLFEKGHSKVDAPPSKSDVRKPQTDAERKAEQDSADREAFEEWKRQRDSGGAQ